LRRLAKELRDLRMAAGLTAEDVADRTSVDERTLRRIENEYQRPQRRTLLALLDLFGIHGDRRQTLINLTKDTGEHGWLRAFGDDLPEVYATYSGFEGEAAEVDNYESLFVPGLLQTREYAHAVIKGTLPESATEDDIATRVEVRMRRQDALSAAEPLRLTAVIDEAALRRVVGSRAVMSAQLRQLAAAAERPNITLRVIPFDAGAHPGMAGSFVLMRFRDPGVPPLVYIDSMAAELILDDTKDLGRYAAVFEQLNAVALSPEKSARLIAEAAGKKTTR
jgi:transcriptional regulator with XRE-family HTH domain